MARSNTLHGFIILATLVTACASSPGFLTRQRFDDIPLGSPLSEVVQTYGAPYSRHSQNDGTEECRYIERIFMGNQAVEENNYILVIKNGQVVAKRYHQELPRAYDEIYNEEPVDPPSEN